jgi:hypothetical protein
VGRYIAYKQSSLSHVYYFLYMSTMHTSPYKSSDSPIGVQSPSSSSPRHHSSRLHSTRYHSSIITSAFTTHHALLHHAITPQLSRPPSSCHHSSIITSSVITPSFILPSLLNYHVICHQALLHHTLYRHGQVISYPSTGLVNIINTRVSFMIPFLYGYHMLHDPMHRTGCTDAYQHTIYL